MSTGRPLAGRCDLQFDAVDIGVRPGTGVLVDVRSGDGTRLIVLAEPAKGVTDYPGVARRSVRSHASGSGFDWTSA